jgi:hypothetical protein
MALDRVMGPEYARTVAACLDQLNHIASDDLVAAAVQAMDLSEYEANSSTPSHDFGAIASLHAWPQADAAYRLGVAMGLVYARLIGGAR